MGAVVLSLGFATAAHGAPAGPGTAQDTIDLLKLNGYQVIVAPTGSKPMSRCTVTSVREGATVTTPTALPGASGAQQVPRYTPVYVEVAC